MTDQELADKIVALGVAHTSDIRATDFGENPRAETIYILNAGPLSACNPKQFVRDWRVAGAMMEKRCVKEDVDGSFGRQNGKWWAAIEDFGDLYFSGESESLPRAINEACAEALS